MASEIRRRTSTRREEAAPRSLAVTAGTHVGARLDLPAHGALLIGRARDCDLCLSDAAVAAHHVLLQVNESGASLRAVDTALSVNGRRLTPGRTQALAPGAELQLCSGVVLTFGSDTAPTASTTRVRPYVLAAVLILVAGIALFLQRSEAGVAGLARETTQSELQAIVAALELHEAVRVEAAEPGWALRGVVEVAERESLGAALDSAGLTARIETTDSRSLLEQVSEVFRTNGFRAELDYRAPGIVEVTNLDADHPGIAGAAAHAQRDIPELRALRFSHATPESPPDTAPTLASLAPGKRLTTIVDGDTAYVAAQDGSRYFVGSLLPGGVQVRRITRNGIQVDRDGELTWLRF